MAKTDHRILHWCKAIFSFTIHFPLVNTPLWLMFLLDKHNNLFLPCLTVIFLQLNFLCRWCPVQTSGHSVPSSSLSCKQTNISRLKTIWPLRFQDFFFIPCLRKVKIDMYPYSCSYLSNTNGILSLDVLSSADITRCLQNDVMAKPLKIPYFS